MFTDTPERLKGLLGLWDVLENTFKDLGESESIWLDDEFWESVLIFINLLLLLCVSFGYLLSIYLKKKDKVLYAPKAYIPPLNIAKEFRERWRTRWKHQQYHEVIQSLTGDQCEIRNYRPVKNTFTENKKSDEVSVIDYKNRLQAAKKVLGYDAPPDSRNKRPCVVFKNYFSKRQPEEDYISGKQSKKKAAIEDTSSNTPSPSLNSSHLLHCNFCTQCFEYRAESLSLD